MKWKSVAVCTAMVILCGWVLALPIGAADDGDAAHHGVSLDPVDVLANVPQSVNPIYVGSQALAFLIVAFLVWKFAFKPVNQMLADREERVRKAIEGADAEREEQMRLRQDYEERIRAIEQEARDRIQQATQEAREAADGIRNDARSERELILERAREDIRRERETLMVELRNLVADMSVSIAEKVIEEDLDRTRHGKLIDDIINQEFKVNGGR